MQTARHRARPDAPTPRAPAVPRRIRRPLPRRSSHVPSAHRTSVPHAPTALHVLSPHTHPYHSPASPRVPVAHPAALPHLPDVPIAPAEHTPPCPLVHPAHRPHLNSLVHPTKVLKLRTFSFLQSISNFVVGLPNLSKRCEGATVPARTTLALRNCHSVSDFIVSLPNVSKKDVKGLLFRK